MNIVALVRKRGPLAAGVCVAALLGITSHAAAAGTAYLERPEVRAFISDLSADHGLEAAELERVLGAAQHQASVVRLIGPERVVDAPPVRSYPRYGAKFLTRERIGSGLTHWQAHEADLRRAERDFGVPAEVVLGIIGVETAFGQNTGSFRMLDALATIAFDGPRRQPYFREELKEFLLLSSERLIDPLAIRGSYAGAIGLPQFMPSSYRRYAVDFDRDGHIDLLGSPADAIGSVASYLKAFGWAPGEAPMVPVQLPSRYVAGFANFEAVTRYNRSTFYATAVLELAEAIRGARERELAANAQAPSPPSS